ncbi:MAG: ATP-binding cassette domain-containing protein [Planctomycetota bacterium]
MAKETPLIELQEVTAGYDPDAPVLHQVSMKLYRGEVGAVVSLDVGGAKTTLLKAAAGLHPPFSGKVLFDGADLYRMSFGADQRFRAKCGVVLEGGALLVNRTVWDNVALPLKYHGARSGRELTVTVERLLAQCGFNEDPLALPWQISDRGQRLAAFARALARDPQVVLVDRFFEGLEMPDWRRLFELVMELNQNQGVSWLLVSEVDPAIFQVAERVAVLEGGHLIAHAHRRKLYEQARLRAAFEAGELRPTRSRTQRADIEGVRAALISSGRVSPLVVDSSSHGLGGSDQDFDMTINIDGILPEPPPPLQSRHDQIMDMELEPTIDLDPGERTVDLDSDGRGGTISLDEEGDPTIFVGSSDAHAALPETPPARPRAGAATVEMEAPTLPDSDEGPIPAEQEEEGGHLEPPRRAKKGTGKKRRLDARTVEMEAPTLPDSDQGPVVSKDPGAKEPKEPVHLDAPARKKGTGKKRRPDARTVEMEAPTLPDSDQEPGTKEPVHLEPPARRAGAATVEMVAPRLDGDDEPPARPALADPAAAARKKQSKQRKRPRAGGEEA